MSGQLTSEGPTSGRFWGLIALPGIVWLLLFVLVPFYAMASVAMGGVDPILGIAVPEWNPVWWNPGRFGSLLRDVVSGGLGDVILRTVVYVALACLLCAVIGYPVAYFVARRSGRRRGVYLALILLPFWINYLMRMLAWVNLLATDGFVNRALSVVGIGPVQWLSGRPLVVVLGLTYGYIPFFVLPLYASLDRIPQSTIEGAQDLGASPAGAFRRVTLPQSIDGLLAGLVLVMLPMFGDFYTSNVLSGSPRTRMLGNEIDTLMNQSTASGGDGAALTILLIACLLLLMTWYLRRISRSEGAESVGVDRPGESAWGSAWPLRLWTWAYIAWSLLPVVIAVAFSFNAGRSQTSWQGFSLRWYLSDEASVLRDASLRGALLQTMKLAVLTTLVAAPLGAALAIGLTRWRGRVATVANATSLMMLVTPEIVIAVGLLLALGQLFGLPLGTLTQVLGLVTFTSALVMVIVRGRLLLVGMEYEHAAMDLGASPWQAFTRVLLRVLAPALVVGALVTFAVTMDDFVIAQYLSGGATTVTISMRLYASTRSSSGPAINALASTLLLTTGIVLGAILIALRAFRRGGESSMSGANAIADIRF